MSTTIYLLGIETSTTNCSVSISKNGKTIAIKEDNSVHYSHAESLHVFIEEIMQVANISLSQLSAIVVGKGPGSYTGLRIGVSTAKGLCYALDIPLIAVNTLESLAHQITSSLSAYIIPMLDARRMEVYTAIFDEKHQEITPTHALILEEQSYLTYLQEKPCFFIGNGVSKFKDLCMHPNAIFKTLHFPSAKELGSIGYFKFQMKQFEDVAYFEPFYLKDFIVNKPKKKP